jgi:hypothetical protein
LEEASSLQAWWNSGALQFRRERLTQMTIFVVRLVEPSALKVTSAANQMKTLTLAYPTLTLSFTPFSWSSKVLHLKVGVIWWYLWKMFSSKS